MEEEAKHSYKFHQVERGLEGTKMLAQFLESKKGLLTISIHESKYSSGSHGFPDLTFGCFGIEVKRCEFFFREKKRYREWKANYYHLGYISLLHESWDALKKWCRIHGKIPVLVVVLTWGKQEPLFIALRQDQVDAWQEDQKQNKWITMNAWKILHEGEILKR